MESFEKLHEFGQNQIKSILTEQKQYVDALSDAVIKGQGHKELLTDMERIFKDEREGFYQKIDEAVRGKVGGFKMPPRAGGRAPDADIGFAVAVKVEYGFRKLITKNGDYPVVPNGILSHK